MMQCRDIDENMVDFLYQELDPAKAAEFQAHVDGCARCGAEVSSLTRTRQALRALPEAEPSPAVSARLLHEASKRAAREQDGSGILGFFAKLLRPAVVHPAWAAAATVLLVVGAATLLTMRGKMSPEAQRYEDRPVAAAAPAPENTRSTTPATLDTDAEKPPRELRPPGSKPDESGGKVAAPAVVATPPAREPAAADDQRLGRAASADEAQRLAKVKSEAPRKKAAVDLKPTAPYDALAPSGAKDGFAEGRRQDRAPAGPEAQKEAQGGQGTAQQPQGIVANAPAAAPATSGGGLGERDRYVAADKAAQAAASPAAPPPPAPAPAKPEPKQAQAQAPGTVTSAPAAEAKNEDAKQQQPPAEQLFQQARQQASTGRCAEALTLSRKIAKVDPEFYKKRVAGDPTLNACTAPRSKLKAAPAQRAPAEEQQQQGSDKSAK